MNQAFRAHKNVSAYVFATSVLAFAALAVPRPIRAESESRRIEVSSFGELIDAVGSNRTIVLKAGAYLIDTSYVTKNPHVEFRDVHDGKELVIRNVEGLSLKSADGASAEILASARYADVLVFEQVRNLMLGGLSLRHTSGAECSGGVLDFTGGQGIVLEALVLEGSGTVGISFADVEDISVRGSTISKCSEAIVRGESSKGIKLSESKFRDNGGGFVLSAVRDAVMERATVEENRSMSPLFQLTDGAELEVTDSEIAGNEVERFASEGAKIRVDNGRVVASGRHGAFSAGTVAPELLQVGTFHGDEVTATTGERWFALHAKGDTFELKEVAVKVNRVRDSILDEPNGELTGKEVSVAGSLTPLVLVRGVPNLREGRLEVAYSGEPLRLYPGSRTQLSLGSSNCELVATGEVTRDVSEGSAGAGYLLIKNYALVHAIPDDPAAGVKSLLRHEAIDEDAGAPQLLWAGDLDRDGALDLLLSTSYHYNLSEVTLYLSSLSNGAKSPVKAAVFGSVGC